MDNSLNLEKPDKVIKYLESSVSVKLIKRPAHPTLLKLFNDPVILFLFDLGCIIPISLCSVVKTSSIIFKYLGSKIFSGRRDFGNSKTPSRGKIGILSG